MDRPEKGSNADKRSGSERREFLYAVHIPERRSGKERRNKFDKKYEFFLDEYCIENNKTFHQHNISDRYFFKKSIRPF